MKTKQLLSTILVAGMALFSACDQKTETSEETIVNKEVLAENKESVDMKVEGMVCAMGCAKFIEKEVGDLSGIVASKVDFEEGTAKFEFDKSVMSAEEIESFINDIHDGQYKASIVSAQSEMEEPKEEEIKETEIENEKEEKESVAAVSQKLQNISFPKLFTYFLKSLR
ncbi:MAG: cation transporter [Vicingaceae bacterium]